MSTTRLPVAGDMIRVERDYLMLGSHLYESGRLQKNSVVIYMGSGWLRPGMVCQIVIAPEVGCVAIPGTEPQDIGTIIT